MSELSVKDLIGRLPAAFISEKSAGVNAVVQLKITGEGGGDWVVTIQNKTCRVQDGVVPNPDLEFEGGASTVLDVFTGKTDGMQAFMQGKLVLRGNIGLAMKLANLFKTA